MADETCRECERLRTLIAEMTAKNAAEIGIQWGTERAAQAETIRLLREALGAIWHLSVGWSAGEETARLLAIHGITYDSLDMDNRTDEQDSAVLDPAKAIADAALDRAKGVR